MKKRKCLISVAVFLLLSVLLGSCSSKSSTATITTGNVEKGTLKVEISASGNLALAQTADLAFDVSGYVYKVYVEVADQVKKGDVVAEIDSSDWESQKVALQKSVLSAKVSVNDAQMALEKAQNPTTTTSVTTGAVSVPDPLEVENKQIQLEMAKMNLESSEKELNRYLETTYNIIAPFDGIVTAVNVKGGAEIYKGSVAVSIADPTKFKADILVNELDIGKIEVGMHAGVELAASSSSSFNAKVTKIAPTGTNSSGVVSYKVTVELSEDQTNSSSGNPIAPPTQLVAVSGQSATGTATAVQPPSGTPPAMGQQGTPPTGGPPSGQTETAASEQLTLDQLKDGYSVTITITIQQKDNVLKVLSKAISRQGGKTVVKIPSGKTTEAVVVKTGISNDEYTEITSGLTEGQEYVISSTTTSSTKTTSSSASALQMGGGSPPSGGGGPPGGF